MEVGIKGHCDGHLNEVPYESDIVRETDKSLYVNLRCPVCGRVRGIRRIIK